MKILRSFGIVASIFFTQLSISGFGSPQDAATEPLSCDQVKEYLAAEKSGAFNSGFTAKKIEEHGVDFETDTSCSLELQKEPGLREPLRRGVKIASLTVQCDPVDCEVTINNERAGTTTGFRLTKSPLRPGP